MKLGVEVEVCSVRLPQMDYNGTVIHREIHILFNSGLSISNY